MSTHNQDNYWDGELLGAVQRRVGKSEHEPEKATLDRIKISLEEGANINVQNPNGDTALHVAIKNDYRLIVEFLLQKGAKTDINNSNDETAIILAKSLQKEDIVSMLRNFVDERNELGVGRSSRANIVSVADEQEPSTSRGGAGGMVKHQRPVTVGSREGSHYSEHQDEANRVPVSEMEETYEPGATLTASWPGIVYQLQHLEFTLHCALQHKDSCFYLATEMVAADKLDDIVLQYKNDHGKQVGRFVQIKYACNKTKMISASELLDAGGGFSIPSYFISWRKVKGNKLFDKIMVRHMILCTNRGLDLTDLRRNQICYQGAEDPDKFFELRSELQGDIERTAWYKLQADEKSNKNLYDKLKQTPHGPKLAELLATCICKKKDPRLEMKMFGLYHLALAKYVFNPATKKFYNEFIEEENSSRNVRKFREAFLSEFRKQRNDPQTNTSDKLIWAEIQELFENLTFRQDFGKVPKDKSNQSTNQVPKSDIYSELPADYYVNDEEIEIFLEEFTLAVNQPDRDELSAIIRRKIHADSRFELLNTELFDYGFQTKMLNWFVKKGEQGKGTEYFSYKVGEEFIKNMNDEVNSLLAKGAIPVYCEWITKYDVHFKSGMQQVKDFLAEDGSNSSSNRILNLVAPKETLLIALKVYDTLKLIPKYKKSDSFIFTRMDSLKLDSNSVKDIFHSQQYLDLLIVDCGLNSTETYLQTLDSLYEIIAKHKHKKMIVITRKGEDLGTQFNLSCETYFEKVENLRFSNLTKDSQKKLLDKQVTKFQGQKNGTTFAKLLGFDEYDNLGEVELEDLSKIMDSETMVQLISADGIQIGVDVKGLEEIRHYYIHRTIRRNVIIKRDILKDDKIPDLYAISGENRLLPTEPLRMEQTSSTTRTFITNTLVDGGMDGDFPSEPRQIGDVSAMGYGTQNLTILGNNREEEQFNALCTKNENRNVHWLQWKRNIWKNEGYVWKKSRGNITSLVKYRDATESDDNHDRTSVIDLSESDLTSHDEPVIISNAAGMGKSTMLTYLVSNIKKKDPDMLVLKIDLNRHAAALEEVREDSRYVLGSIDGAVQFLVKKLLSGETGLTQKVYERIIKRKHKVGLIFDGFDEICPDYKNTVIDLLKTLAEYGIKKLFVATRPHTRETLETKLNAFSYEIKPFSTHDQKRFLIDVWKAEFGNSNNDLKEKTENRIIKYTNAIMQKLADSIYDQENKFTGNPLQAYLVAEIFGNQREETQEPFDSCKDFIDSESDELKFPERINLIYLYEHFVEKKFDAYFKTTGAEPAAVSTKKVRKEYFKKFVDKHKLLALNALFSKNVIEELLPSQRNSSHESLETTDADIVERDGIVTQFVDGQPQFGHRTYAEYFAAKFFTEMLKTREQNQSMGYIFVKDVLLGDYETLRTFMDWLLSIEHVDVLKGEFWPRYLMTIRSRMNETILHVAAAEGNGHITRLFLNCLGADTNNRRELISFKDCIGRTAVHRAVEYGHLDKIRLLFEGTDFNVGTQNWYGVPLLHIAAKKEKLDVVEYLIGKGADIDSLDRDGVTPLHIAALGEKLDMVEYLVSNGADINSQDKKDCRTPLHCAAFKGEFNIVEYFISKGANIDSQDKEGRTALHDAALGGKLNVVEYLVSNGADINSQDKKDCRTPLHCAAFKGEFNIVEYFISKGANIYSQDKEGRTALHDAALGGKLNVVEYLVSNGADINSQDKNSRTVLHEAVKGGKLDVVEYLVSNGADINSQYKNGHTVLYEAGRKLNLLEYLCSNGADINSQGKCCWTPLHCAAFKGEFNIVEYLVRKGAYINSYADIGRTALHFATMREKLDVVEYLVSNGADINSQDMYGRIPLHYAALGDQLDVVEYLVSNGADIDSQDMNGYTPLYAAELGGKLNIVGYLASLGAGINSQDTNGVTPLHAAILGGTLDVVKYLVSNGADINSVDNKDCATPLHYAAFLGKLNIVEYFISKGADIDFQDKSGRTALHVATVGGKLDIVECLVSNGADINSQDNKDCSTPLHWAAFKGEFIIVEYFISKGADIDVQDKNGHTALHLATLGGKLDVVECLVSKGADINSPDIYGYMPLHSAVEAKKWDIVKHLLSRGAHG